MLQIPPWKTLQTYFKHVMKYHKFSTLVLCILLQGTTYCKKKQPKRQVNICETILQHWQGKSLSAISYTSFMQHIPKPWVSFDVLQKEDFIFMVVNQKGIGSRQPWNETTLQDDTFTRLQYIKQHSARAVNDIITRWYQDDTYLEAHWKSQHCKNKYLLHLLGIAVGYL